MTELQILRARALRKCMVTPGLAHERFARQIDVWASVNPGALLTSQEAQHLARLSWRYRRQMPAALVPAQDPDTFGQSNVTEGLGETDDRQLPLTTDH